MTKLNSFLWGVMVFLVACGNPPPPNTGQPSVQSTFGSVHSATASGSVTLDIPTVTGGTDQKYVLGISAIDNGGQVINSVTGGGLTWTQRIEQCRGNSASSEVFVFDAFGTASADPFTITITFDDAIVNTIAHVLRYTGSQNTSVDFVGENTNGENGACTGGTSSTAAQLTTGSTIANSHHVVFTDTGRRTISTADVDYTERANTSQGAGGTQIRLYAHDFFDTGTGDNQCNHTTSVADQWMMAGMMVEDGGSGAPAATLIMIGMN